MRSQLPQYLQELKNKPLPESEKDLKREIKECNKKISEEGLELNEVEVQLYYDRISHCETKLAELAKSKIKITPVLGTTTIGESRKNRKPSTSYMSDSSFRIF